MRSIFLFPAVMLACVAAASPAIAQDATADVRCLMVSNVFSNAEKDPQRKQLAQAASVYYLGRADARLNPAQLKAQIVAQAKSFSPATAGPIMTECAKRLGVRQQQMVAMGKELAAAGAPKK